MTRSSPRLVKHNKETWAQSLSLQQPGLLGVQVPKDPRPKIRLLQIPDTQGLPLTDHLAVYVEVAVVVVVVGYGFGLV